MLPYGKLRLAGSTALPRGALQLHKGKTNSMHNLAPLGRAVLSYPYRVTSIFFSWTCADVPRCV